MTGRRKSTCPGPWDSVLSPSVRRGVLVNRRPILRRRHRRCRSSLASTEKGEGCPPPPPLRPRGRPKTSRGPLLIRWLRRRGRHAARAVIPLQAHARVGPGGVLAGGARTSFVGRLSRSRPPDWGSRGERAREGRVRDRGRRFLHARLAALSLSPGLRRPSESMRRCLPRGGRCRHGSSRCRGLS